MRLVQQVKDLNLPSRDPVNRQEWRPCDHQFQRPSHPSFTTDTWVLRQRFGLRLNLFIELDSSYWVFLGDVIELVISLLAGLKKPPDHHVSLEGVLNFV
nr:hypothetical protein [Fluviibacter phosphoraccumulans]